jgi:predicted transglutaminase-like cysteine proteinase
MLARISAAVAVLSLSCAAASPDDNRLDGNRLGRFTITKLDYPPDVLARGGAVKQASVLTEAVLENGEIKEIRSYRDFLRKTARLGSKFDQLKAVNGYVSRHVRVIADANLYQRNDVWAPPINTLILGGDCEDIALVKSWGLKYIGFPAKDLFVVVGVSSNVEPPEGHAVLVARLPDGQFYALDNLDPRVLPFGTIKSFEPAYAVNALGYWNVNDPNRSYSDFWRRAFQASATRHAR